ncbi:MAG TPA: hypothetical protein VM166_15290 [Gemmatimonadaceae bacterium]|nr:hypothetical protein [Gemmatimonadaceae bacterium]
MTAGAPNSGFLWSDAWLLLAVDIARTESSVSLAGALGAGDAINHAVFTREELSGAINRLGRAGYLTFVEPNSLAITTSGAAVLRDATKGKRGWRARQTRLEQLLGVDGTLQRPDPRRANDGEEWSLAQSVYDEVVRHYLKA